MSLILNDDIFGKLFLGDINDSKNEQFLLNNNINVVINCSKEIAFYKMEKIRVELDDSLQNDDIFLMESIFIF